MNNPRFAVILGASGEIGQAISRNLASLGWSLYLHYNEGESEAEKLQVALKEQYPHLVFQMVQADFSSNNGASVLAKQLAEVHAVIVANGQPMYKLLSETTTSDMDALWKVHVQNPAHFIGLVSSKLRLKSSFIYCFHRFHLGKYWGSWRSDVFSG